MVVSPLLHYYHGSLFYQYCNSNNVIEAVLSCAACIYGCVGLRAELCVLVDRRAESEESGDDEGKKKGLKGESDPQQGTGGEFEFL